MERLKKNYGLTCVLYLFGIAFGKANPLWDWLEHTDTFVAQVSQIQCHAGSNLTEKTDGELSCKRSTRQFKWESKDPNDLVIVSDGETVWFYDRAIDQVTVQSLEDWTQQPLFRILLGDRKKILEDYWIREAADLGCLTLCAKHPDSEFTEIKLVFKEGQLREVQLTASGQQRNTISFVPDKNRVLTKDLFTFIPPEGAMIDDQRKSFSIAK